MRSEREKGGDHVQGDSKGRSPWRAFGDFPRDGKVTRVQGGAPAGGRRGYQPRINFRGMGRSALPFEGVGAQRGRSPLAKKRETCYNKKAVYNFLKKEKADSEGRTLCPEGRRPAFGRSRSA